MRRPAMQTSRLEGAADDPLKYWFDNLTSTTGGAAPSLTAFRSAMLSGTQTTGWRSRGPPCRIHISRLGEAEGLIIKLGGSLHYRLSRGARPGETRQEQLRQAGAEENQGRGFRVLEPGTGRLGHEACRQGEQRSEG